MRRIACFALLSLWLTGCVDARIGADEGPCAGIVGLSCAFPIAQLTPQPHFISFSNRPGADTTLAVTVTSTGDAPVRLTEVVLESPSDFSFRLSPDDAPRTRAELDETLAPGASFTVDVTYDGTAHGDDRATLTFHSDGISGPVRLSIGTVDEIRRLQLSPAELDFGTVLVGDELSASLELVNNGVLVAELLSIEPLGSPLYDVDRPATPRSLAPGESVTIDVWFRPTESRAAVGALGVEYTYGDDDTRRELHAQLYGNRYADEPTCLIATASGQVVLDGQGNAVVDAPRSATLSVEARSTVRLIGGVDPAQSVEFRWRVAQVPPDFSLDFRDDRAQTTEVRLLQPGRYVFELELVADTRVASCAPVRVTIDVEVP